MTEKKDVYISPLVERNASQEMAELFGAQKKFALFAAIISETYKKYPPLAIYTFSV